ncbi:MAG TPA: MraY family glycosyltransferase [Acidimicrobiales bacterium]|nr:MraY family glycosyltransferase [Acidimicrobiales bacterium]
MIGLGAYLTVLAVATGVTVVATPLFRRFALARRLVHAPDERRVHEVPTPTLGGVAMLAGVLVAMLVAWRMDAFAPVFAASTEPLGVVLAVLVIHTVGAVDELRKTVARTYLADGISAPAKLAGMVLAGSVLSFAGVSILHFRIPFGDQLGLGDLVVLSPDLSALLTVVWVVGMVNAVNLIDGLDGLAAGIVAIASGAFFLYSELLADRGFIGPENLGPLVAIITLGVCLGFLPWNVHPAKIFMGDNGALMLGLLMAASTISVGGRTDDPFSGQTFFFFAPLVIPLVILGVPILDTAASIVRRARNRTGVATADKNHLHHRLMRLGHGQWRSVAILWTWTALLSGFVLYPAFTGTGDAIVPLGVAALALALYTLFHPGVRRARAAAGGVGADDGVPD